MNQVVDFLGSFAAATCATLMVGDEQAMRVTRREQTAQQIVDGRDLLREETRLRRCSSEDVSIASSSGTGPSPDANSAAVASNSLVDRPCSEGWACCPGCYWAIKASAIEGWKRTGCDIGLTGCSPATVLASTPNLKTAAVALHEMHLFRRPAERQPWFLEA